MNTDDIIPMSNNTDLNDEYDDYDEYSEEIDTKKLKEEKKAKKKKEKKKNKSKKHKSKVRTIIKDKKLVDTPENINRVKPPMKKRIRIKPETSRVIKKGIDEEDYFNEIEYNSDGEPIGDYLVPEEQPGNELQYQHKKFTKVNPNLLMPDLKQLACDGQDAPLVPKGGGMPRHVTGKSSTVDPIQKDKKTRLLRTIGIAIFVIIFAILIFYFTYKYYNSYSTPAFTPITTETIVQAEKEAEPDPLMGQQVDKVLNFEPKRTVTGGNKSPKSNAKFWMFKKKARIENAKNTQSGGANTKTKKPRKVKETTSTATKKPRGRPKKKK
jgi:hypothetical protein